jgi:RHS repeat-associated protein
VSGRTAQQGYTLSDNVRQKFTQKERDIETGLDYFLARYYSSTQGRFTSPDEFKGGPDELYEFADNASENPTFYAELKKPQSLNKYQYAYNNPLRYTDPDGHDPDSEPEPQDPKCPCQMTPAQQEQMQKDVDNLFQKAHDALVPVGNAIMKGLTTIIIASASVQMVAHDPGALVNSGIDANAIPAVQVAPIVRPAPLTGTPAQTQAKPRTETITRMSPRPIDKPDPRRHRNKQGKKNWDKDTGTRSGDKKPPGFKPRVPKRPQDMEPKPPKPEGET